jgi:hypothetical protein
MLVIMVVITLIRNDNVTSSYNIETVKGRTLVSPQHLYFQVIEFETTDGYKCIAVLHKQSPSLSCNWNK